MAKVFYTERDIEDLAARGILSLALNDDVVVTDQARERAHRLGVQLVRGDEVAGSAPAAMPGTASAVHSQGVAMAAPTANLEQRVLSAVQARLGDSVDAKLLETIVKRVLQNVGGK